MKKIILSLCIVFSIVAIFLYFDKEKESKNNSISSNTHINSGKLGSQENKGKKSVDFESRPVQSRIKSELDAQDKINLTNKIAIVSEFAFAASKNQSAIIADLTTEDKKAFREIDQEGRKSLKIVSLGKTTGQPNETIGPIRIQTKPNKPIFLRAIDKGVFSNGAPEIFVRADEKGLAIIDFKFGKGMGAYRVLINVAGCGNEQVSYQCQPKENPDVSSETKENKEVVAPIQEVK
jgi:hypothetical protein